MRLMQNTCKVLKTTGVVFLVNVILCSKKTSSFEGFYAVRTGEYPKSSCHKITNVESAGRCLGTCGILKDSSIMISHDTATKACMCCHDITGGDIIGSHWKTYIPPPCANGYASYDLSDSRICVKYFPVAVSYQTASALCQSEGGNLIKIDSQEKFDIFKDYHVPIANNTFIDVWVQGEKVGGQWQFNDGSPIPEYCRIGMTNGINEVHLRARGSTDFSCFDGPETLLFHYSCEYHRLFSIKN